MKGGGVDRFGLFVCKCALCRFFVVFPFCVFVFLIDSVVLHKMPLARCVWGHHCTNCPTLQTVSSKSQLSRPTIRAQTIGPAYWAFEIGARRTILKCSCESHLDTRSVNSSFSALLPIRARCLVVTPSQHLHGGTGLRRDSERFSTRRASFSKGSGGRASATGKAARPMGAGRCVWRCSDVRAFRL